MAKIDMSDKAIEVYCREKKKIVEREAYRIWQKMFYKTGVIALDDVVQEGYKALVITLAYFNKSKSPIGALDAYLCMGIQGELKNWVMKVTRQFNFTYDEPETIFNIPETLQDLLPTFEDLEVLTPLSKDAMEFLNCLFSPPVELKGKIKKKVTSGKPYAKSILPLILEWMSIGYDEFNIIKDELQCKCKYSPLQTASI